MSRNQNDLIGTLVGELEPTTPLTRLRGSVAVAAATALTIAMVVALDGLRSDLLGGAYDSGFLLSTGSFLMLGLSASFVVIGMGRPQVGNDHRGWMWAAAMTALVPLAGLMMFAGQPEAAADPHFTEHGLDCVVNGTALGLISAAILTLWLQRGAPTDPAMAGWLTGVAAGSLGIFAYSLHCPYNDMIHIGLWHSLVIPVCALLGRLAVPRLVRW